MTFIQAVAPNGPRTGEILSSANSIPERHIVIETLRNAAPRLGLSATVISTLDAMLSCLAPKRNHHTVFASNATLTFRRNGISDRTIRRHAAALQEAGLLARHDSPNRKRFTRHSAHESKVLRFGFDLTPLFSRLHEIAALAAEVLREREQIAYLRAKIRTAANNSLLANQDDATALDTLRTLRRRLSIQDCERLLSEQTITCLAAEADADQTSPQSTSLSGSDGHFVRHHHNSNKEDIDKERKAGENEARLITQEQPITVPELLAACPEAAQYSLRKIETAHDVIAHARTLAPMIGISNESYEAAHERLGALGAAATVWAIMQFHGKIKVVGAYFRSITTGSKSAGFSPEKLVRRLGSEQRCAG